jgi:membrane-associated phospholipid phosphatase
MRAGSRGDQGRQRRAVLAATTYRLFLPHSGAARRIAKADLSLFRRITGSQSPLLDRGLPALSRMANHSQLWWLIAACLATWGGRFGKRAAIRGLGSIAATSTLVSRVLKPAFRRPRPALQDIPLARQLTRRPRTASFPSGHAASAFAFAVGASCEVPALAPPLALLAAAVGYSRVYSGVHYPVDILVGGGVGAGVALLSRPAWPLVPRAARKAGASAERQQLAPNDDGSGLALVVNPEAGPAFRGAPLDQIRERLFRARIVERDEQEDLSEIPRRAR